MSRESAPTKIILSFELGLSLKYDVRLDLSSLEKPSVKSKHAPVFSLINSSKVCIEDFPLKSMLIRSSLPEIDLISSPQRKKLQSIPSNNCNSLMID